MAAHRRANPSTVELADLAMLTVVFVWASNNVLTKEALDRGLEPLVYVALRFGLVVAVLFGWLAARGQLRVVRRADLPRFLLSGLCGFALYNLLFVIGLAHTSTFSAAVLISLAPVFILLISAALHIERVRPAQWAGVILALAGVAIFIGDKLVSGEPAIGDVLNILAAVSFAMYGTSTRALVVRYGSQVTTAWSVLVGLIAIVPISAHALWTEEWTTIDPVGWIAIVYAAIVSMMLGYALWGWAMARTGAGRSVPYLFLIPVITGLLAVVLRHEHLDAAQIVGGAVALTGVAAARIAARWGGSDTGRLAHAAAGNRAVAEPVPPAAEPR